jgi:hypothetical protein
MSLYIKLDLLDLQKDIVERIMCSMPLSKSNKVMIQ